MRNKPNKEFANMKKNLIIGIRKTHKFVENHKTSDFLVPYTSSGCTASCLYCYLVCNYNKCVTGMGYIRPIMALYIEG